MKKFVFILFLVSIVLSACQLQTQNTSTSNNNNHYEPDKSISVRGLDEVLTMREMLTASEDVMHQYLRSIGGGPHDRKDLENFLQLLNTLPYVPLIDGEISWISHSYGESQDTGDYYSVFFVSTKASNGEWVRIEYILSTEDVMQKISEETQEMTAMQPIHSSDNRMTVYAEKREPHPSETGELINWIANIDGYFARIIYYSNNAENIPSTNVLSTITLTTIENHDPN